EEMLESYKNYFSFKKETKNAQMLYAKNVPECLAILNKDNPSLMFLDLCIEPVSPPPGFKILEDYKDKLKIIVISGYHEHKEKCMADGAIDFLGKPTDAREMIKLMIQHVG